VRRHHRRRCALVAIVALVAGVLVHAVAPGGVAAQTYPGATPLPRSTDPAVLRANALAREVHERFRLGLAAEGRGDWQRAVAEFARVLQLRPAEPAGSTAHYDLALAYVGLERLRDAESEFRAAIALDPGFLAALANLTAIQLRAGELEAARATADTFVRIAPGSARALYSRGLVALRAGDAQTAAADFSKLLERNPAAAIAHYDLGLAEVRLARFDAAERELRAALELAPEYARARFALGTVLLRENRRGEARAAFEQTIRTSIDPSLVNLATAMRDSIVIGTR
jgi:tetratricopeptide (TPR) repeat protein